MMKKLAIGLDIGGTKIRGIIFDGKKVIFRKEYIYPRKPPNKREFFRAVFEVTDQLSKSTEAARILGIGIGTAGIISANQVFPGPNLKAVAGMDLIKKLRKRYLVPVKIQNDVKTAALAEYLLGAAKNYKSMVMITLGSGLGGAYIKDGEIQRGSFSSAYEMGFIIIDSKNALKGKRGDFEWFCSEKFFITRGIDPIDAEIKARRGNFSMKKLWQEFGKYLGIGVASIINIIEPEIFVIGGGISNAWPLFASTMKKTARKLIISPPAKQKTKIVNSKLGKDAGAIGAALMILEQSYPQPKPLTEQK